METTARMRRAALELFLETGPRTVTLNAVAQRSHYSIGAVYQRWSDREDLLRDLIEGDLVPALDRLVAEMAAGTDPAVTVSLLLDHRAEGHHPALVLAELLFAARDDETFAETTRQAVSRLLAAIARAEGGGDGAEVLAWWLLCSGIGASLLRSLGIRVPDLGAQLDRFLVDHGRAPEPRIATSPEADIRAVEGFSVRPLGHPPAASDPVALGLVEAGVEIVGSEGVEAATARSIAGRAGVSTGALYRRFRDRGALLADVLVASLGPERYTWVQEWIETLGTPDRAASLMAEVMSRAWTDEREARLLLELSVAAHHPGSVRDEVAQRISEGVASREEMFCVLHEAGLLTEAARSDLLGWVFQLSPIGARLLGAMGIVPDMDELRALTARFLSAVILPEERATPDAAVEHPG